MRGRQSAARWLVSATLCAALGCGGAAAHGPPRPEPSSGASGAPSEGESGRAGQTAADGGSPPDTGGTGGTAAPGIGGNTSPDGGAAAGGSPDDPQPLIDSGSRLCTTEEDCLGLECVRRGAEPQAICATSCDSDLACPRFQGCFSASRLAPICLTRCVGITDCPFAFDCFDPEKNGAYWCVPAAWTQRWDYYR